MYNKKCISTFLFSLALVSLITLILPFIGIGLIGSPNVLVKVFYYIFITIYAISIVLIILLGIYNLFKNSFIFTSIQETLSYIALAMLLLNILIVLPINGVGLSVGYSILTLEAFILACFNSILRLFLKLPKSFKTISDYFKQKKEQKLKILEEKQRLENEAKKNAHQLKLDLDNEDGSITISDYNDDEVKIIPPDEEIV